MARSVRRWGEWIVYLALILLSLVVCARRFPRFSFNLEDPGLWFIICASVLLATLAMLVLRGVEELFLWCFPRVPGEGATRRRAAWGRMAVAGGVAALLAGLIWQELERKVESHRQMIRWMKRRQEINEPSRILRAIRSAEIAYFAEWTVYVGNQPPTPVASRAGNAAPARWDPATRFSLLGFTPEEDVRCSYRLAGADWPTKAEGFTATAECDPDGSGQVLVYRVTSASSEVEQVRPGKRTGAGRPAP